MYGYEWTEEYGIFRLTVNAKIQKEIRPVFHDELDFFGMDEFWDYPKDTDAPLLWAEGIRRYVINGVCVAEAQGGAFYTKPVIKRLTGERLQLHPVDMERLYEVNRPLMISLEQKAIHFIQTQYDRFHSMRYEFVCAFSGGKSLYCTVPNWSVYNSAERDDTNQAGFVQSLLKLPNIFR